MKKEFINWDVPVQYEMYNSNNSWGFGGARGIRYHFASNLVVLVAWAGTRHRGEFPFITLTYNSVKVLDLSGHSSIMKKKIKELVHVCLILNLLTKECTNHL